MKIAVIGLGTMGAGVALQCALCGLEIVNVGRNPEKLERAEKSALASIAKLADKGKITQEARAKAEACIRFSTEMGSIADADVVIEAISESLEDKKAMYAAIAANAKKDAFVFTNTSGFRISDLAESAPDSARFMGMHFFNPVPLMKLVELVRGEKTSDETYQTAKELSGLLGKTTVDAPESAGFIVNRILIPMINEAASVAAEGVQASDIDTAMKLGANFPMGPLALADLIGIDVIQAIMENLQNGLHDDAYAPHPVLKEMIDLGKLGRKSKKGFFDYD